MDISDKPDTLKSLEMAKKRNKKVYITDIAIDKVPLIEYYGFTDEQNQIMQELAKNVLVISNPNSVLCSQPNILNKCSFLIFIIYSCSSI